MFGKNRERYFKLISRVDKILSELRSYKSLSTIFYREGEDAFKEIAAQMSKVIKQQQKILKAMQDVVGEIESADVMDEHDEMETLKYVIRQGFEMGADRDVMRRDAISSGYSGEEFEKVLDELDKQDEERNKRRNTKKNQ